jgi:cytochrome b subunit of formate dehydrogenase
MTLIILGVILFVTGGVLFYRLRRSEAEDNTLKARLHTATELYEAIRHEPSNARWIINRARNDVYFRRLDVRFKSWNLLVRKVMYLLAGVMIVQGVVLIVIELSLRGII